MLVFIIVDMGTREQMISTGVKKTEEVATNNNKNMMSYLFQMESNQNQRSVPEQEQQADQKKKSEKNKFINKLKQFQKNSNSQMKTGPHSYPSSVAASLEPSSRKERNKIAARQSRDRKKLYVQLVERKIQILEAELEDTVKTIQQVRLNIFSAEMRQGSKGKEANHRQMHIIKKLEGLLEDQSLQERNNQINICLDSVIYRIGALGKERKAALSKLYFDLLNFSQPALYRYILWSAVKGKHLFGQIESSEEEKWCREIEQISSEVMDDEESRRGLQEIGQKIACHFHHFKKSAEDLVKFRSEIQKKGHVLDNVFNEIREVLTPDQIANVILFVEKYQFKKQVRLFEEDNPEELGKPTKRIKCEEQYQWF